MILLSKETLAAPVASSTMASERNLRYIRVTFSFRKTMPKTKIATLNLRIDPGVKEAVREAADRDHRSIANMVEMLIRRHCDEAGITIPEQSDLFPEKKDG